MISSAQQVLLHFAAYEWVGKGDGKAADGAAVESMRSVFDSIPFNGRVAIGEGERGTTLQCSGLERRWVL